MMPEKNNNNVIESILKHPIAFGMIMHSILSTIQCIRKGKMEPFFNISINSKNSKTTNKTEEAKDA